MDVSSALQKVEVGEDDEEIGECTKCKMVQSTNDGKRSVSAQVTVKANGMMMSL